jgi:alkylhydroperoxidase family enzyme
MHAQELKEAGESDERIFAVSGWRDAPYFTDAERAALALTEAATRLSDRPDPVPDEVWDEAARHYDEPELASLVISIAAINAWNRLNVATRQVAGAWK